MFQLKSNKHRIKMEKKNTPHKDKINTNNVL